MPVSIHGGSYGTARLFQQGSATSPWCSFAAIAAIYVVLGMLYESYSQPLTILSTLPSAGLGALLALLATGTEFSLIAFLGILLLIGIVKKNAIMMVDFALDAERTSGWIRARRSRTPAAALPADHDDHLAAIAGALPLAIAYGNGTEMRRPLGIAIVGGLMSVSSSRCTRRRSSISICTATGNDCKDGKYLAAAGRAKAERSGGASIGPSGACDMIAAASPAQHCRAVLRRRPSPPAARSGPTTRRPPFDTAPALQGGRGLEAERAQRWSTRAVVDGLQRPVLDRLEEQDRYLEPERQGRRGRLRAGARVGRPGARAASGPPCGSAARNRSANAAGSVRVPARGGTVYRPAAAAPRPINQNTYQAGVRPTGRSTSGARSVAPSKATSPPRRRARPTLAAARLSAQATLATDYFELRAARPAGKAARRHRGRRDAVAQDHREPL